MDALREFREISLGSRLNRMSDVMMKETQKVYTYYGIDFDPYLFPAFKIISLKNKTTNTEIRELLNVSQPAITQTLHKLLKKELININSDEIDKRKKIISLSDKGEKLLIKMIPIWNVIHETVEKLTTFPSENLVGHLSQLEDAFSEKSMSERVISNMKSSEHSEITIISFDEKYTEDFYNLNIEWLETFFYVESHDKVVLSNAKSYIIDKGGHIFFAKDGEHIVGTVALIKIEDGIFELSKMAVSPAFRGKKIGQKLMQHCISFSKEQNYTKLILYSNRKLENAIYIYEKYGFKEIPMEKDSPYERSNIKMELPLDS
ncbi:bifunctional helix-turn-helix transcriptional regulator/GNAT family N-acetyltransferase [Kordia sp.]|uniref:bifunctional helix-turn-helix transcriptional regulator/GNAT family N-acetyltransferase n=1 Tax=Kordia sp. TaxID=1965332 RepID=UPI0025C5E8BA|nr:bifunctional helix-turn-helix transcriptional regulator/GNAT family N-acetyltransferase [Kordia sp.]MCH2196625.1 bifunctional helix-turn-helix transcriptional regulator/GNAT family N-acetyltransferase [Kordia sp.]